MRRSVIASMRCSACSTDVRATPAVRLSFACNAASAGLLERQSRLYCSKLASCATISVMSRRHSHAIDDGPSAISISAASPNRRGSRRGAGARDATRGFARETIRASSRRVPGSRRTTMPDSRKACAAAAKPNA